MIMKLFFSQEFGFRNSELCPICRKVPFQNGMNDICTMIRKLFKWIEESWSEANRNKKKNKKPNQESSYWIKAISLSKIKQ